MPTVGRAPAAEAEKARRASMVSLPAFAYAVASGYTKNGAPLPVRFWTLKSFAIVVAFVAKSAVRNVSCITFGSVGTRLFEVLLTVPKSLRPELVLTASCAPTAKPESTHTPPSLRVITPVAPPLVVLIVTGTASSCANGLGPKIPSESTSVRPPYQMPSCDVSP